MSEKLKNFVAIFAVCMTHAFIDDGLFYVNSWYCHWFQDFNIETCVVVLVWFRAFNKWYLRKTKYVERRYLRDIIYNIWPTAATAYTFIIRENVIDFNIWRKFSAKPDAFRLAIFFLYFFELHMHTESGKCPNISFFCF